MLNEYIKYINNNPRGYWFKRKWYGWGWTPATWQGWVLTIVYVALVLTIGFRVDANSHSVSDTLYGIVVPVGILTVVLITICFWRGEKPRWSWGRPRL